MLADISKGKIIHLAKELPDWIMKYLDEHFQQKLEQNINIKEMKTIDEVKKAYKKLRHKP